MRDDVPARHLGKVCDILDSRRKPITKRDRVPGPYPYYGAAGVLDYVEGCIFDEPLVLIGEDGAKWGAGERTAYMVEGKCWVNNHAHVIRPNRDLILDSWVVYYLNAIDLAPFISGLTVPKLNQARLREIPIPLPPLPEQKRIVAILDEALAGIATAVANTEKNLVNARELFESYLNSAFSRLQVTCEAKTISEIAAVKGGKRVPKGYKFQTNPTGFPYITVSAFTDEGGIDPSGVKYIDEDIYKQISRYIITTSDVYISIAGTIGKSGIISEDLDGANLTENACRLIFQPEIFNRFVYFFTKTLSFEDQALKNTRIAAQPKLALERLKTITLPIPSRELQEQMVSEFDGLLAEVRRLESIQHQKLAALAELKQSLLQKAFSGELTADKDVSNAFEHKEEVA